MAQLYMLSVLSLIAAGFILSADYLVERVDSLAALKDIAHRRNLRIGIGATAGVVGVLKLIVRSPGETVPVAGDLLPAVAGIVLGGMLLADTLRIPREDEPVAVDKVAKAVMPYRTPIGLAGVAIGLVHFLLPSLIIL